MKKYLLVLTLTLTAYFSKAQIAASDAITLSRFINDTAFSDKPEDVAIIVGILRNYITSIPAEQEANIDDIITLITTNSPDNPDYNPFIARYFSTGRAQSAGTAKLLRRMSSCFRKIRTRPSPRSLPRSENS